MAKVKKTKNKKKRHCEICGAKAELIATTVGASWGGRPRGDIIQLGTEWYLCSVCVAALITTSISEVTTEPYDPDAEGVSDDS